MHGIRLAGWVGVWLAVCSLWAKAETPAPLTSAPDALQRYVARPESVFRYELVESRSTDTGTSHEYKLTSQTWQDIVWEHALMVYEPPQIEHPRHMLLMVTGGRNGRAPGPDERLLGLALAQRCGGRVAILHQVPNQPLLGDRVEDDLITETWLKYLETGDDTWPLLFPMVKSAVKAMDALQEIAKTSWDTTIDGFVITGASKRGWTSWLTPAADPRVIATAPMVIDTLNFPVQMKHQLEVWGQYSEQIEDYTSKGLVRPEGEPRTPREESLWRMMDPYTYRQQLKLPKLLICGTNDRYWVVNAMSNYWHDLPETKHILEVPNSGHSLKNGRDLVITTIAVFFRHAALGRSLPEVRWNYTGENGRLELQLESDRAPVAARIWTAESPTQDFRDSVWTAQSLPGEGPMFSGGVERQPTGHQAIFGELLFQEFGMDFSLTTLVYTTVPRAKRVQGGE